MPKPVPRVPGVDPGVVHVSAEKRRMGVVLQRKADTEQHFVDSEGIKNPAYVATEMSVTKNMDKYGFPFESLRVGVVISSPCENTPEAKHSRHEADVQLALDMIAKEAEQLSNTWF